MPFAVQHVPAIGHACVLHAWLNVAPPHTASVPWVQDWEVPGFAARHSASARTAPSYRRHCTVRDRVPFEPRAQVAVRDWVPLPHEREQLPHAEYDHVPVSPEQAPQAPSDHEFATQDEPFHA